MKTKGAEKTVRVSVALRVSVSKPSPFLAVQPV
jgi:hypothetical protein